jgi:hypothetical protein
MLVIWYRVTALVYINIRCKVAMLVIWYRVTPGIYISNRYRVTALIYPKI